MLDSVYVIDGKTTGAIVRALMQRAGLSVREFALGAGYKHGSGVQRYIEADFDGLLSPSVAKRLAAALSGRGSPAIDAREVFRLVGMEGPVEARQTDVLPPKYRELPKDVPVYGTAIGTFSEDERIEQTVLEFGETVDHVERPPGLLNRQGVYGMYVEGDSQSVRFEPGDLIFVDPKAPARVGDDVVVYIKKPEGDGEAIAAVLVKRLLRKAHDRIDLRQFNPPADFSVDARKVGAIHKILSNKELYNTR